mmetsp:Transcript_30727/g.44078  ORF Transcript_30727/g.44078 Transcript_30727/m.44078 type:complete len:223 (-) Transcript_30727:2454-3122(-)
MAVSVGGRQGGGRRQVHELVQQLHAPQLPPLGHRRSHEVQRAVQAALPHVPEERVRQELQQRTLGVGLLRGPREGEPVRGGRDGDEAPPQQLVQQVLQGAAVVPVTCRQGPHQHRVAPLVLRRGQAPQHVAVAVQQPQQPRERPAAAAAHADDALQQQGGGRGVHGVLLLLGLRLRAAGRQRHLQQPPGLLLLEAAAVDGPAVGGDPVLHVLGVRAGLYLTA